MEEYGVLDKEGKENILTIKQAAQTIWGDDCKIETIQENNSPFCMFEILMNIYGCFDVLLTYDRSILGIHVKSNGEYLNIRRFTDKKMKGGFESCKLENLLYNFRILDEVLHTIK